jgi:nicotinamidase/pyrazinamidase
LGERAGALAFTLRGKGLVAGHRDRGTRPGADAAAIRGTTLRSLGGYDAVVIGYEPGTALLVVDVQNDFADPEGSLHVRGGDEVIPILNREIQRALAAGAPVIYTQDWHPESTPHFAKDGGIWPVHCVQGTWGAAFHPELVVGDAVVRKGENGEDGYSGFTMRNPTSGETIPTRLAGLLRDAGMSAVVIGGLATDYCVKATALDARSLGFAATVLAAGVRAVDLEAGDGDRAIREMEEAGVSIETATE